MCNFIRWKLLHTFHGEVLHSCGSRRNFSNSNYGDFFHCRYGCLGSVSVPLVCIYNSIEDDWAYYKGFEAYNFDVCGTMTVTIGTTGGAWISSYLHFHHNSTLAKCRSLLVSWWSSEKLLLSTHQCTEREYLGKMAVLQDMQCLSLMGNTERTQMRADPQEAARRLLRNGPPLRRLCCRLSPWCWNIHVH